MKWLRGEFHEIPLHAGPTGHRPIPAAATAMSWSKLGIGVVKIAGKPQGAHQEDPLRIIHVAPHLADAPFLRRVPIERLLFRDAAQKRKRFVQLAF